MKIFFIILCTISFCIVSGAENEKPKICDMCKKTSSSDCYSCCQCNNSNCILGCKSFKDPNAYNTCVNTCSTNFGSCNKACESKK